MMKQKQETVIIILGLAAFLVVVVLVLIGISRMAGQGYVGMIKVEGLILEDRAIIKQLHKFGDQPAVKAIVLHMNTPGGTLASAQSISKEIQLLRRQGKPVVVSMAEVCASAGYYIACSTDRIFANPASITGSLGVILRYPEAGGLMQKLGLRMEVVKSGEFKDIGDFARRLNKPEKKILQAMLDDLHEQFVEMVLDARGDKIAQTMAAAQKINLTDLHPEEVKKHLGRLADGRVFTGRQALHLGLVDKLGNLDDAVLSAAFLGKIRGRPKVIQEREPNLMRRLLQSAQNGHKGILGTILGLEYGFWLEHLLESTP
ncbi:signal peptide peptidase SppA [candidate division FCPU426 bacterium]|nr:signal peptide peptidase SppA [candidate division FCPU426 bacterium]